ncbi:MAG: ATPase with chaperone activity [Burkholderiales bacterium]
MNPHIAMTDEFQINIPASFIALYLAPGKVKPTLGQRALAARYELCEDLANLLTEKAANLQFTLGITEELVLEQCEAALLTEPAVVSPTEARWVVCRLAELLQWPMRQAAGDLS